MTTIDSRQESLPTHSNSNEETSIVAEIEEID